MTQPSNEEAHSIVVEDLTKLYGDVRAIDQINFSIQPGQIVGFLGPNGAGKTTTMKILTCFMAATGGTAKVAGFNTATEPNEVKKRLGYLPEQVPLYDEMLVRDYLNFIAEVRGVPRAERAARIDEVVQLTGLHLVIHKAIAELSKGYRQRVGLAQAIIHRPEVVILDEPTTGLDPNQIIEIREVIRAIGKEKTVLFSTHIMQEVVAVCDRVIIINKGEIVADGSVEALQQQLIDKTPGVVITIEDPGKKKQRVLDDIQALKHAQAIHHMASAPGELTMRIETKSSAALLKSLFDLASKGQLVLRQQGPYQPTLETIFRTLTGGHTEEERMGLQEEE